MVTVARLWHGQTAVCIASGPSLTAEDCEAVRGQARVIAVNDAVRLAPWADVLYSSDCGFWKRVNGAPAFEGAKYAVEQGRNSGRSRFPWNDVAVLRNTGLQGLELDPTGLKTYKNSGGAAINLAVHFGVTRIVLLGYDLSRGAQGAMHFYPEGPRSASPYQEFRRHMETMVGPLKAVGVEVLNASRKSALTIFPRVSLEQAIARSVAA